MYLNPRNYDEKKESSSKIHEIIQKYRSKENEKLMMMNKLNVLKKSYQNNMNKAKLLSHKTQKVRIIKEQHNNNKQSINLFLQSSRQSQLKKLESDRMNRAAREAEMGKMKHILMSDRSKTYNQAKEKEKIIRQTIYRNWQNSLREKRQKSHQIRINQEKSKINRTLYLQKKRISAQRQSSTEISYLQDFTKENEKELNEMKRLEKEIVEQLNSSRVSLKRSKVGLSKVLRA